MVGLLLIDQYVAYFQVHVSQAHTLFPGHPGMTSHRLMPHVFCRLQNWMQSVTPLTWQADPWTPFDRAQRTTTVARITEISWVFLIFCVSVCNRYFWLLFQGFSKTEGLNCKTINEECTFLLRLLLPVFNFFSLLNSTSSNSSPSPNIWKNEIWHNSYPLFLSHSSLSEVYNSLGLQKATIFGFWMCQFHFFNFFLPSQGRPSCGYFREILSWPKSFDSYIRLTFLFVELQFPVKKCISCCFL